MANMLRSVVVHQQHRLPASAGSVSVSRRRICRLALGQVRLDAVQEQRGLVEQPLRRPHVLDDDGLGQRAAARRPPRRGQLLAGVDDDGHARECRPVSLIARISSKPGHPRQLADRAPCSRTARLASSASASSPLPTAVVMHVAVADQLDDALALDLVVLDDQQRASPAARGSSGCAPSASSDGLLVGRLLQVGDGARSRGRAARSSDAEMTCTGMCRVRGSCFS